jgi:hypothetical protein
MRIHQLLLSLAVAAATLTPPFISGRMGIALAQEPAAPPANSLTDAEKDAGWKLLFDGKSLDGWHNFKKNTIGAGWKVVDGTLACVDTATSGGDLLTRDPFSWFELSLEYNISEGGNSGVIYHISNSGSSTWATGPEVQIQDNINWHDPELSGWLYALYKPPVDPTTSKPLDATKPFGQWNLLRIVLTKEKCEHYMNGVKYFEYQLGSDDFKAQVAKSKFAQMANFAKSETGFIALQGDHGRVSFKNIKIRPIVSK